MMERPIISLDGAATTPVDERVMEAMLPYFSRHSGNPSSIHASGRAARTAVERAREDVAELLGADPAEIVFTGSGTESNLTALYGVMCGGADARTRLVTSRAEHQAVLRPARHLSSQGTDVVFLDAGADALVSESAIEEAVDSTTALLSLMLVNNETGAVHDVAAMARIAHAHGALFHTDAAQAAGKMTLDVHASGVDLLSCSAHKIHGPKGAGALYIRRGLSLPPFMRGGSQERGRRAGTENVPAIVGFGMAARLAIEELDARRVRWMACRTEALRMLLDGCPGAVINGNDESQSPAILSITFPDQIFAIDGEALLLRLDLDGVEVSSGSACTAGSLEPSHVMRAVGHDERSAIATLRLSFDATTTPEQVRDACGRIVHIVSLLRGREGRDYPGRE